MKRPQGPIQQLLTSVDTRNHLYRGDCLDVLDRIDDESVDLIYIDPPFFSQRYYETIWGEEAERFAFEDRWKGGINTYLNNLAERIRKMYLKLKPTGLFYLHLDWHIGHYMKIEVDKIFGYGNFRNEIVWCYAGGGFQKRTFRASTMSFLDTQRVTTIIISRSIVHIRRVHSNAGARR